MAEMTTMNSEEKAWVVKHIEQVRDSRGLKQVQLSELSGVPQPQISKIFSHQLEPPVEVLRKLSEALGLKLDDLLEEAPRSDELVGYLATPLTGLSGEAERERDRVVAEIREIASADEFKDPSLRFYWPGDFTHPTKNADFTPSQVYLTDRSRASAYDFILLFCASRSYGVGQENEIATQAGLPAIRLVPEGLTRMMLGSFIRATDVQYEGDLQSTISFERESLLSALREIRALHFGHRALYQGMNGNGFGERLRTLLSERRRGDYAHFAEDLGVSLGYVTSLMDEPFIVTNPSARLLKRMSRLLGVRVGYLLGETMESDPILTQSRATWNAWIEGNPSVEAVYAERIWRDWEEEDRQSRRGPQLVSMRQSERRPLREAEWDKRYQDLKRAVKPGSHPGKKQKALF